MTTPANWYPDPEDPAGLRYWDGTGWTEHRAPAVAPEGPSAPADEIPGDEPAAESGQEPSDPASFTPTPGQPYDTHPQVSWNPPMPAWDTPPTAWEAPPVEPSYAPPPAQSFQAAPFAPPPGPPPGDGPNKKLVIGILGGAAAILLALVVVIVLVVMRKDVSTVTTSRTTPSSTSETTSSKTPSESSGESSTAASPTPPPTGAEGSDGDYTFSVAGTDTGDTITSTVSDAVQTTADGVFYVVYVNVSNTGTAPLTFVATFQQLSAAGQTFPLDDEATAFLGGTIATVAPGDAVETPLVYDVPVGTTPDSIMLRADPSTAGVQLPLQ
ncbi:DUF2510 domain-containing protein [Mycolicibacterium hodleri]|uniref:DUF2510 domain-containing protein n=1 Tax=Mycolicibacterium hodleri TaxID=49897 RepID=A0A502EA34_9MYCO|nr:DUF2510 domain-containing protein [Mycolicibacterium hodleri]TPG34237.1 DUF2510 domain-containing protein [Mycolicibacterium hodleri]